MKRNYKVLLLVMAISIGLWSFMPNFGSKKTSSEDPEKDKILLELLTYVLEKGHYQPQKFDDALSKKVYTEYIKDLDPSKRFFLQSDIDEFAKYQDKIDDQILAKDLTFFDLTYNRLMQRMKESQNYYQEYLENPIDYTVDETISFDYDHLPYAQNTDELKDRWRKNVKFSALGNLTDKQKIQEENAKNAGKSKEVRLQEYKEKMGMRYTKDLEKKFLENLEKSSVEAPKSYDELEKESRETTKKSFDEMFINMKDLNRDDFFGVYINAITSQFDPHTNYFPPVEKEKFDASMSGKFEGIGARLQKKGETTEISELISGGPAWKGKELEAGDKILKVAQGNKEPVDVVGMRIDDVVKKIKGPKGTEVKLTIKKTDGSIRVISIIRDEVELEETYAKSSIVEKNGSKYGILYLPKFYIDFENKDKRDAYKDVAQEIERLKQAGIKGLIFDVRDNGGGSLKTVVDIAGLFIEKGPIVQVKAPQGVEPPLADKDPKVQWDGPLVIMINEFSASASEILAAAMQDYNRAIIIGSKQSYGKGTVQNMINLNNFLRNSNVGDLGAVKETTQKFYRINGGSTQMEGVKSDVIMPDKYAYLKMGERDEKSALPFDKIEALNYSTWTQNKNFDTAINNSKKRIAQNTQWNLIDENAKWMKSRENDNIISLNIDKYKTHQKQLEDTANKYKVLSKYSNNLNFNSLPYEEAQMQANEDLKLKREIWHDELSKDIYVDEALNILNDMNGAPTTTKTTKPFTKKNTKQLVKN